MQILKGKQKANIFIGFVGSPGVGKTTLASKASKPLIIDCERGSLQVDCDRVMVNSFQELKDAARFAYQSDDYETVVFDSADAIEKMISEEILKNQEDEGRKKESLAEFGYQKGFDMLAYQYSKFMDICQTILQRKNIILICHEKVEKVDNLLGESYDRFQLALHKKVLPLVIPRLDAILLMKYDLILKNGQKDMTGKHKKVAIGDGTRVIYTEERPHHIGKNRFGLPYRIENIESIYELIKERMN